VDILNEKALLDIDNVNCSNAEIREEFRILYNKDFRKL